MDAQRLLRRVCTPAVADGQLCARLAALSVLSVSLLAGAGRRHQSTANRTKRARSVAPHPAFGGGSAAAAAAAAARMPGAAVLGKLGATTTVLYNPPASAPTVYQTPFKFLPATDRRRRTNLTTFFASESKPASASASASASGPARFTSPIIPRRQLTPDQQKYHLTEADVAELRRLRALDPIEWSVFRLARHFRCSPIFVMLAVQSSPEHRAAVKARVDAARSRWGPIRTKARADRVKRREMLYRGEL